MSGKKEVEAAKQAEAVKTKAPAAAATTAAAPSEKKASTTTKRKKRAAEEDAVAAAPLTKKLVPTAAATASAVQKPSGGGDLTVDEMDTEQAPSSGDVKINIPVVMLGKADADRLAELLLYNEQLLEQRKLRQQAATAETSHTEDDNSIQSELPLPSPLEFSIDISAQNMLLSSELMGDFDYPKVYVKANIVFILGAGSWGTFMTSATGEDWQLYLMARRDMAASALIPAISVKEEGGGLPVSVTANVLTNAVDLYRYTIAMQCPDVFLVAKDGSLRLKRER